MLMIGQAIPEGTYQTYHQHEIQSVTLKPDLDLAGKI